MVQLRLNQFSVSVFHTNILWQKLRIRLALLAKMTLAAMLEVHVDGLHKGKQGLTKKYCANMLCMNFTYVLLTYSICLKVDVSLLTPISMESL